MTSKTKDMKERSENFLEAHPVFKPVFKKIFDSSEEFIRKIRSILIKEKITISLSTIVDLYIAVHPEIKNESWRWKATANRIILYESSEGWKNFFETEYNDPHKCIKFIPGNRSQSIATIITYYLTYHPDLAKEQRAWSNAANAKVLYEKNIEWKTFFDTKFSNPDECVKSIPGGNKLSIATIMNYYLTFYPDFNKGKFRQWINIANMKVLCDNNREWKKFFEKKFKNPKECFDEIPEISTISPVTVINYYLAYHQELSKKHRLWIDAANAKKLYDSDEKWKFFFDAEYDNPGECIAAIPNTKEQSIATIVAYYLSFHLELSKKSRFWISAATAKILYDSDKKWKFFFDAEYDNPRECIEAIPETKKQSIATIVSYYLILKDNPGKNNFSVGLANAILFFEQYPELLAITGDELFDMVEELKSSNELPSTNSIKIYFNFIQKYEIDIDFIKKYGNYISLFRHNPELVKWLLKEIRQKQDVNSIVIEFKKKYDFLPPGRIKKYIEIIKRYYEKGIVKELLR